MTTATVAYSRKLIWWLTAGGFLSFFIFGFVDNLKGPTLPALLRDLNFSYGQGGVILLGAYIGFLVATLLTGVLADVAGKKTVLVIAGVCISVGMFVFSVSSTFGLLILAMSILGVGMGSIEVGANALIVDLHQGQQGRYLNLLAVFHGVGSLIVPIYAGFLLENAFTWRQIYQFSLILALLLPLYFVVIKYPRRHTGLGSGGLDWRLVRQTGFTRRMFWFYLMIAVYVAAELGLAAWLVEFLQQAKSFSVGRSSFYLSLFFGGLMVGRLLGSFVVERIGYLQVMLVASIAAILFLLIGIFGPPALAIFLPAVGLCFSIIFPTTTAAVSEIHPENTGTILGLLFAFAGLGGALGPWAIGLASDWVGIQLGFALSISYCVLMIVALFILRQITR